MRMKDLDGPRADVTLVEEAAKGCEDQPYRCDTTIVFPRCLTWQGHIFPPPGNCIASSIELFAIPTMYSCRDRCLLFERRVPALH